MVPRSQKAGEHKGSLEKTQDTEILKAHQAGRVVTEDINHWVVWEGWIGRVCSPSLSLQELQDIR